MGSQGTPEQRRACTPDVYRLCAGEIPNARAVIACLRRQKASPEGTRSWQHFLIANLVEILPGLVPTKDKQVAGL
nr:hypothetical protein [Bradyrhizobium australiense]